MTDPTSGFDRNDEFTEALRRDLRSALVPYDDERADLMISQATEVQLLDARRWNAPLAAAAAVVLVGGGVAVIAANVGHGHHSGAAAAGGGGPNVQVCGTAGPLPSPEPTVPSTGPATTPARSEPTESPVSTSAVVHGGLPPVIRPFPSSSVPQRVRVGVTPSVVNPVVVSPTTASPVALPSDVASPVASPTGSDGTDPCAIPSSIAPPVSSSAPGPVVSPTPSTPESTTPAVTQPPASDTTSTAYVPPVPPTPTKPGETNAGPIVITIQSAAGGTTTREIGPIAFGAKFVATELVFSNNVPGTTGTLDLDSAEQGPLTVALQDFNRFEYHLHETFAVVGGDHISLTCTGAAACDVTVTLIGN